MSELKYHTKNQPIATIIKWFSERKKGKIDEARKEIKRRFNYLDWKDQKKIILLFLNSCRTDRTWIYPKVYGCWDKSFMPVVKDVWEKYHEEKCSWLIIRYSPLEYIQSNIEQFSFENNYFFICLRFMHEHVPFVIEKHRLTPDQYLFLLKEKGEKLTDEQALDFLFDVLHKYTTGVNLSVFWYWTYSGYTLEPKTAMSSRYIERLVIDFSNMGCKKAIAAFKKWDNDLLMTIKRSPEYNRLKRKILTIENIHAETLLSHDGCDCEYMRIAKKYIYICLPSKYKSSNDELSHMGKSFYDGKSLNHVEKNHQNNTTIIKEDPLGLEVFENEVPF